MGDLAPLGLKFFTEGAEQTERKLDSITQKSVQAEKATDALAGGQRRASSATMQMLASIERAIRQQHEFVRGLAEGAAAAAREAAEIEKAREAARRIADEKRRAAAAAAELASRAAALKATVDPLGASIDRVNKELMEAGALFKAGAISAADYGQAQTVLTARLNALQMAHGKGAASARLQAHEVTNLGRQFADLGVMAAMGMSPLMILVSQGPQIADVFASASARGMGFGQVMGQIGGMIRPFLPLMLGIGAAVGAVVGGFALFHRELSKGIPDDLTKGMGLTEEQLDRVTQKSVTMGDTLQATFKVVGAAIMDGPIGDGLRWLGETFSKVLDTIARATLNATANIVAFWAAAFKTIVQHWRQFPDVMLAITTGWINTAISHLEGFINAAIKGYNRLAQAEKTIFPFINRPELQQVSLGRMEQAKTPAAATFEAEFERTRDGFLKAARDLGAAIGEEAAAIRRRKILEEAGRAPKGRTTRTPEMDERAASQLAQIDRQLEQAKLEELRLQLQLTESLTERLRIELEIARAEFAVQQAQNRVAKERILADDRLTDAAKAQMLFALDALEAQQLVNQLLRERGIIQATQRQIEEQQFQAAQRLLDADIAELDAQLAGARTWQQRRDLEAAIFAKQVEQRQAQIKRLREEAERTEDAAKAADAVARERELQADIIRENIRRERELSDKVRGVGTELERLIAALRNHDWAALPTAIFDFIETLKTIRNEWSSMGTQDRIMAVGSIAQTVGGAVGGTAGGAISGGASGAMAAAMFTGNPLIIAGAAVIGAIFGGLSSSKAEKARKQAEERQRQEERARRAAEVAQQARELELALAEATGDVLGALNAQRAAFMEGIAEENRVLAERVFALQQAKQAQEQYNQLFLTEAERIAFLAGQVGDGFKSLGLEAVDTLAEFKALADGIDRTTDEGQRLFAGLMALGPAFGQVAGFIASVQGAATALTPFQVAQGNLSSAQARVEQARAALQAALQAETQANSEAAQAAAQVASQFRSLSDSLASYLRQLNQADATDRTTALRLSRAQFQSLAGRRDPESLRQLTGAADAFLEASRGGSTSAVAFARDLAAVRAAVTNAQKFAEAQATEAEQTVAALNAQTAIMTQQVNALLGVDGSVMSVEQAIAELKAAEAELALAETAFENEQIKLLTQIRDALQSGTGQGATGTGGFDPAALLRQRPDILTEYLQESTRDAKSIAHLRSLGINSAEDYARWHAAGMPPGGLGAAIAAGFANGGASVGGVITRPTLYPVGEAGDEAILPLVNIGGQQGVRATGADDDAIHALRGDVQRLERALVAIATNTRKAAGKLERFEDEGMPVRGPTPGSAVPTEAA